MITESSNKKTRANGSQFRRLRRLARKELIEILRDRRTIITLVLMPMLVYPLMGILVQKFLLNSLTNENEVVFQIGFADKDDQEVFGRFFAVGDQMLAVIEDAKTNESQLPNELPDSSISLEDVRDAFAPGKPKIAAVLLLSLIHI